MHGFLSHLHSLMVTMSQKSFVPQAAKSVSQELMSDTDAQEPHPAGELLFARPARGSDRSLRRPLQSPALPREHRQSDASRRLLRTRSNHPAGKRKDQTQNHPTPTLASQNSRSLKSNRMRQNFP